MQEYFRVVRVPVNARNAGTKGTGTREAAACAGRVRSRKIFEERDRKSARTRPAIQE